MSIRVVFEVSCTTLSSEELRLTGSLPELGAWDPTHAVPLFTNERIYPVWQTAEIVLPPEAAEAVVQYKYFKQLGGAVQWEAGLQRVLDVSCLSDSMVNYVDDAKFDWDTSLPRRHSGPRIRFQEPSKSQMTSLVTSRMASSAPSPLRTSAGPTPVEKSPSCLGDLENILRELMELETRNFACQKDIRRAVAAIQSAIQVECSQRQGQEQPERCKTVGCALMLVPLLPVAVASALVWRVPSAQHRRDQLFDAAKAVLNRPFGHPMAATQPGHSHHHGWTFATPPVERASVLESSGSKPSGAGLNGRKHEEVPSHPVRTQTWVQVAVLAVAHRARRKPPPSTRSRFQVQILGLDH